MKPGRGKALDPTGFERASRFREPLSTMGRTTQASSTLGLAWLSGILPLGVVGIVIARRGEEAADSWNLFLHACASGPGSSSPVPSSR